MLPFSLDKQFQKAQQDEYEDGSLSQSDLLLNALFYAVLRAPGSEVRGILETDLRQAVTANHSVSEYLRLTQLAVKRGWLLVKKAGDGDRFFLTPTGRTKYAELQNRYRGTWNRTHARPGR